MVLVGGDFIFGVLGIRLIRVNRLDVDCKGEDLRLIFLFWFEVFFLIFRKDGFSFNWGGEDGGRGMKEKIECVLDVMMVYIIYLD